MKKYTLLYLLNKQPSYIRNHSDYSLLKALYNSNQILKKINFSRLAYSLINNVKIKNLESFYKKYNMPKNPFFPVFLKIRKEYIDYKKIKKKEKSDFINSRLKYLDNTEKEYMKYLKKIEVNYNHSKKNPLWTKHFIPKTKKMTEQLLKQQKNDWYNMFNLFFNELEKKYKSIDKTYNEKIIYLYILELPIKKHTNDEIKSQYRLLSKKYHPDKGGNNVDFNLISTACKNLIAKN